MNFDLNHQAYAAELRGAIEQTTAHLLTYVVKPGGPDEALRERLRDHLGALLDQERRFFTLGSTSSVVIGSSDKIFPEIDEMHRAFQGVSIRELHKAPAEAPWYPDDSGEWVEVPPELVSQPALLDDETEVEVLLACERQTLTHTADPNPTASWVWNHSVSYPERIVAYKVVKP